MLKNIQYLFSGIFLIPCLCSAMIPAGNGNGMEEVTVTELSTVDSIGRAIEYQMEHYPESQYRDVYKNFMQDFFGPGHILTDTAASGRYLRNELATDDPFLGPLYEPTGYKGNFYRVNLSLIKDGVVPYDIFFDSFVKSVQEIIPPSGEEWMGRWKMIDGVIKKMGLIFPDEERDRRELNEQFENGDYVVHHSQRYNDSVHFHYRIVSKENFERRILPLLQNRKITE